MMRPTCRIFCLLFTAALVTQAFPAGARETILTNFSTSAGGFLWPFTSDGQGNLYSVTISSNGGFGTLFTIRTDGTGFTLLHSFEGTSSNPGYPVGRLAYASDGTLYGACDFGGAYGIGAVYRIRTDGSGFAIVHSFTASDGDTPVRGVSLDSSGNLYGTTTTDGPAGKGTIYRLRTDGSGFTVLHAFAGGASDGAGGASELVFGDDGFLYGTTPSGMIAGTVYRVRPNGTGYQIVHAFAGGAGDGDTPYSGVTVAGPVLYGTTSKGCAGNLGCVYQVGTDGSAFTILHSFSGGAGDGSDPESHLLELSDGYLYGTSDSGGPVNDGVIFRIKTGGASYQVLHSFEGGATDGKAPFGPLFEDSAGTLHGVTEEGGPGDHGTIYSIHTDGSQFAIVTLPPPLPAAPDAPPIEDASGNIYGTVARGGASGQGAVFARSPGGSLRYLHTFGGAPGDGGDPLAAHLTLGSDGFLYGATYAGGTDNQGTVYRVRTDGTGFELLHSFSYAASEGNPSTALVFDGAGNLYGGASFGGPNEVSNIYSLTTSGAAFTVLHMFDKSVEGSDPTSLLLGPDGLLYGTADEDGQYSSGTMFRLSTDGQVFSHIYSFGGGPDGYAPNNLLFVPPNVLVGTSQGGGEYDAGVLFASMSDGSRFSPIYSFGADSLGATFPTGDIAIDKDLNIYGTTFYGGVAGGGTIWKYAGSTSTYTTLRAFLGGPGDGAFPYGVTLTTSGDLIGSCVAGGSGGGGVLFDFLETQDRTTAQPAASSGLATVSGR